VRGLSRLPNIQRVELELERGGEVSLDTIEALCSCPQLEELRLWRMTLHPEHLIRIADIIENNTTVHHLELGEMGYADHGFATYSAVAQMLLHNTCLETFEMINFSGLKDEGCILMAKALCNNNTLTDLSVRGCDNHVLSMPAAQAVATMFVQNQTIRQFSMNTVGVDDDGAVVLAQALGHHNHTLQTLMLQKIVGNKQRGYLSFEDMLETNFQLRRVFPEAEADVKQKMDFYLTLNRLGLRQVQLYVNTSRTQFCQMLYGSRQDLDVIFYLLSTNPEILDV
jgi:Ran GTPase-activating protein (RanGAP) involved in mRNA processing and transport